MPEIKLKDAYKVEIIESERGWGQKVDEVKYFDNEKEAKAFCERYNRENTSDVVPDWYMVANYCGKVR